MKNHDDKLNIKHKLSLTSFYGKANNSKNCLFRSLTVLRKSKELNHSLVPSSPHSDKIRKINKKNLSTLNNQQSFIKTSPNIKDKNLYLNSTISLSQTSSDVISPMRSIKHINMGNVQKIIGFNQEFKKDLKKQEQDELVKIIPSGSNLEKEKDDSHSNDYMSLLPEKRPKLGPDVNYPSQTDNTKTEANSFLFDLMVDKYFTDLQNSYETSKKINGSMKSISKNMNGKSSPCLDSTPILLDEDDISTSSKDVLNTVSSSESKLFDYPNSQISGRLSITKHDIKCLQPVEYLNDVIIDFYLKYIYYELLSPMEQSQMYIYSSFFYSRLISTSSHNSRKRTISDTQNTALQRHSRIQTWTRNIDIFEKDFLLIPINQHHHWFLAIICFAGKCSEIYDKLGNHSNDPDFYDIISEYLTNQKKRPCILIFDSLSPNPEKWDVSTTLREYLQVEWNLRKNSNLGSEIFTKKIMRGNCVKCPQQANSYDCGIYLLLYAEYFFTKPVQTYKLPIKSCEKWFSATDASKMRMKLKLIIQELTKKFNKQTN